MSPSVPIRLVTRTNAQQAVAQIRQADRIGVDTEFHAEGRFEPRLLLVQVHVPGGTTWLIDPLADGIVNLLLVTDEEPGLDPEEIDRRQARRRRRQGLRWRRRALLHRDSLR